MFPEVRTLNYIFFVMQYFSNRKGYWGAGDTGLYLYTYVCLSVSDLVIIILHGSDFPTMSYEHITSHLVRIFFQSPQKEPQFHKNL